MLAILPGTRDEHPIGRGDEAIAREGNVVEMPTNEDGLLRPGPLQIRDPQPIDLDAMITVDEQQRIALMHAKPRQLAAQALGAGRCVTSEFLAGFGVQEEDGAVVGDEEFCSPG